MIIDGIDFILTRKKVKYLRITIKQDKTVKVSVPYKMKEKQVTDFLYSKVGWVQKHLEKPIAKEQNECSSLNQNDKIYLWGREYTLNITRGAKNNCTYDDMHIWATVKNLEDGSKFKLLKKFYRAELLKRAEIYLAHWQRVTGLESRELRIKDMKTRWGTCNIAVKRIWLSQRLVKFPEFCLEYVVLHELLHLVEKNHNHNFYQLLTAYLPDWKKAKARLRYGESEKS